MRRWPRVPFADGHQCQNNPQRTIPKFFSSIRLHSGIPASFEVHSNYNWLPRKRDGRRIIQHRRYFGRHGRGARLGPRSRLVWCTGLFFIACSLWSYLGATVRTPPAMLTGTVMILPFLSAGFLAWTFSVWVIAPDRQVRCSSLPSRCCGSLCSGGQLGPFQRTGTPNALTVMSGM